MADGPVDGEGLLAVGKGHGEVSERGEVPGEAEQGQQQQETADVQAGCSVREMEEVSGREQGSSDGEE